MSTTNKDFRVKNGLVTEGTITASGNVSGNNLLSTNSANDEGGEIFLNKPVTNTTINTGVNIDIYQNRLRFFESGGTNRGFYLDITTGAGAAGTALGAGGGTTTNALTIGTGLSGTSFNGSAAVTIAIDSTVATLTGVQTLTNKTLTSPTLTTPSIGVATGTSFNSITGLSSTTPIVDGTAAVGTATTTARADHVHPTDTTRAPLNSPTFTGTVTIPAGSSITGVPYLASANTFTTSPQQINAASSTVGFIVRANATSPGDMTQWQNSGGTVLSIVDFAGRVGLRTGGSVLSSTLAVSPSSASAVAVTIRGVASQSANLQEWQDSSGNILTQVSSAGALTLWANDGANAHRTIVTANTSGVILNTTRSAGTASTFVIQTDGSERFSVQAGGTAQFTNTAAAATGLIIRGAASQSANLQEWQNSSTTVLAKVDASGNLTAASFVKTSGTSAQFLKADGSVDSSTYLTTATASSTYAPLASPTFTGVPLSTTAAADTNTTQIATTAYVVGQASSSNPIALGSVAIGTSLRYARADHVHPTTGLGLTSGTLAQFAATTSSQLAGVISDETGSGALVFANSPTLVTPVLGVATGTSFNSITGLASTTSPMNGTAAVGTGTTVARVDHVHPTDTSRAPLASPTFTGTVTVPSPTNSTDAATKQYVDDLAQGLHIHASVVAATTANLTANYSNGSSGVGATLTNSGTLVAFSVDGISPAQNDRILVKNQSTTFQNGVYTLTTVGSGSVAWVLTRATDFDTAAEMDGGDFVFVTGGTVGDNTGWVQTETVTTVGTSPVLFTQFSGAGTYLAGNGLTLTGNTFTINTSITADLSTAQTLTNKTINGSSNTITNVSLTTGVSGTLPVANGGTGITSFGTGIATFLGTPSSANLAAAITDETGTGSLVFSASPTFTGTVNAAAITTTGAVSINTTGTGTINLGDGAITKASGSGFQFNSGAVFSQTISASGLAGSLLTSTVGTALGTAAAGTATVPARADHVHPTTGLGLTASGLNQFASTTSSQLAGVISDETGSGALVFANTPTLVTPNIGVATGTSFNSITGLSSTTPIVNGTAAVGTATTTARADHVHPTDTTRAALSGATFTGQIQSTLAGSTANGQLYLNGATSNRIDFNINGIAAPAFTNRSTGTKIVLYPNIGAAAVDYAIGIESGNVWFSSATSSNGFKWYAGTTNIATLTGAGAFSAVTKSFDIEHPTKEGMRLRYGSLEGPENGVYVRGKSKEKTIELPDYWIGLVDKETITVNLTAIGSGTLYVKEIIDNTVIVGGTVKEFFFTVYGERKDVDKLTVEY